MAMKRWVRVSTGCAETVNLSLQKKKLNRVQIRNMCQQITWVKTSLFDRLAKCEQKIWKSKVQVFCVGWDIGCRAKGSESPRTAGLWHVPMGNASSTKLELSRDLPQIIC